MPPDPTETTRTSGAVIPRPYRVWAEIDLAAMRRNLARCRSITKPGTRVLAVLKADAYGHGAIPCAFALTSGPAPADYIGVGDSQEALQLREAGIAAPILILGAIIEGELPRVVEHDITPSIHSTSILLKLDAEARRQGKRLKVHVKVDTGMGRLGVSHEQAGMLLRDLKQCTNLELEGLATHFSSAHEPSRAFTHRQLERFLRVLGLARDLGFDPPLIHAANAPALLNYEASHFTMVRPGLSLYGQDPGQWEAPPADRLTFEPILSLFSQVCFIKHAVPEGTPISYSRRYYTPAPTDIATLPIGYNDGYWRCFGEHGASALIRGIRAPVVGVVTMDYTMLDVGHIPGVEVGEPVTLIGSALRAQAAGLRAPAARPSVARGGDAPADQAGDPVNQREGGSPTPAGSNPTRDRITVEELATLAQTIPYEITCRLGRRVVRLYRAADGDETAPFEPFTPPET